MRVWSYLAGGALLILSGCASVSLVEVSKEYYEGNPNKAYELAKEGIKLPEEGEENNGAEGDELLWQIQGGIVGFDLQKPEAKTFLELAEQNINLNELQGALSAFFENFGAVLVNDTVMSYKGFLYEGAMVNYYGSR